MAVYNVVGYYNTGFGAGNVPDGPAVVQLATSKTFPSNWLLQDRDLATTRLNANWADVQNIDYVRIGSVYYFVTGVRMLTEVCAELALQIDPLTTAGGIAALDLTDGWCTRAHAASDGLFENTLPEPWTPSNEMVISAPVKFGPSGNSATMIVAATVELDKVEAVAKAFLDDEGNIACYVPQVPTITGEFGAFSSLATANGTREQLLPGTALYNLSSVTDGVTTVRSLGIESCISGCYALPIGWGRLSGSYTYGKVEGVNHVGTGPAYRYASANNAKVFALYNEYTLLSMATGDKKTFDAPAIYSSDAAPSFIAYADPAPNGRPYAQPINYEGRKALDFQNAVAGGEWLNQPIVYSGASGSLIQQNQFDRQQELERSQYNAGVLSRGVGIIGQALSGNLLGAIGNTAQWATTGAVDQFNFWEGQQLSKDAFAAGQAIRAPEVTFAYSPSIQAYVGNNFVIYQTRLSAADVSRFDRFLTMFGYAQSKQLVKSDFTNRRYFNYVQADNVGVTGNVGLRIREGVTKMLSGGVRIWHTLPNSSYYSSNPIG